MILSRGHAHKKDLARYSLFSDFSTLSVVSFFCMLLASRRQNMLDYYVSISSQPTPKDWWKKIRPRLTLCYAVVAIALLILSGIGHARLLGEVNSIFGGFFWAIDNTDGQIVIVSAPPQSMHIPISANSLTSNTHIIRANGLTGQDALTRVYQHAHDKELITYTIQVNNQHTRNITLPATVFTFDMWWSNYGLALLAGLSWLLVGAALLATARDWSGAVEGLTLLPPAMLFLLYSHWGNVQHLYYADPVFQLLWVPSFALLGAAFIHLSLTYRPVMLGAERMPRMVVDGLPYLPLIALLTYEWSSFLLFKQVPTRPNLIVSLGYAVIGGIISFCIGINSLFHVGRLEWIYKRTKRVSANERIPSHIRRRISDLLTLWIGGVGLGCCLGALPILLNGQTLLPLSMFYLLAAAYPLILAYAIRSLRLVDRLQETLELRSVALQQQRETAQELLQTNQKLQQTTEELLRSNQQLQQATSLLLHADAHLRSLLSQRIHDQPKQQALRIRSLLAYWQHKLHVEAEHDQAGKVAAQPLLDALGKMRVISEELESDLRGLQLLVEDVYQRRSLGLKLHLEKLIREDLPALHPETQLTVKMELWALDALSNTLEQTPAGEKVAEAISYIVTQALLNIYNHAKATTAYVQAIRQGQVLEVLIHDNGRGFDTEHISPEKTSLFKARLKAQEAGGTLTITSIVYPQPQHGTTITLHLPLPFPYNEPVRRAKTVPLIESDMQEIP